MAENTRTEIDVTALGNCIVLGPASVKIQMQQFWNKQPAVFIFLRHFACIACRAHAQQVWSDRKKYESSGGKLVFVGNGQPHFIEKFREDMKMKDALIVTDPTHEVFKKAGFRDGFFYVAQPASVINAVKLVAQGHKQTAYSADQGTHWQLGGILVVSPAGKPTYHYISEALGDFPEEKQLRFIQRNEQIEAP